MQAAQEAARAELCVGAVRRQRVCVRLQTALGCSLPYLHTGKAPGVSASFWWAWQGLAVQTCCWGCGGKRQHCMLSMIHFALQYLVLQGACQRTSSVTCVCVCVECVERRIETGSELANDVCRCVVCRGKGANSCDLCLFAAWRCALQGSDTLLDAAAALLLGWDERMPEQHRHRTPAVSAGLWLMQLDMVLATPDPTVATVSRTVRMGHACPVLPAAVYVSV